jgi:hypothetical protein
MVPNSVPDFHNSKGEERLYQALRTLPDEITVIHSLRWVHPGNARSLKLDLGAQGEGDFVIFDPRRGILVVEVKGGRVWCAQGEWFQQNRRTGEIFRINPEAQASNTMHRIRSELIDRVRSTEGLVFGHAVWFPDGAVDCSLLPINYHAEITFHGDHVAEPALAVTTAFNFWSRALERRSKGLSPDQAQRVMDVLAPSLSIVRSVRQTLDEREERLLQLTQEQAAVVQFLDEQAHAAIHGAAGTGKTLVAVEKARRLAAPTDQVLFLCYNNALQQHLSQHHAQPNVEYLTFHGVVRRMMGGNGELDAATEAFLEYLADDKPLPYDHIIVDEGQDFAATWLEFLRERFRKGAFYVFYDRHQAVQGEKDTSWMDDIPCRLVLTRNCRNTDQVAKLAYRAGMLGLAPTLGVSGPKPMLHLVSSKGQAGLLATSLIESAIREHKVAPSDIAVLLLEGIGQDSAWSVKRLGGVPVADRPTPGHITVTTPRRFKGLEATLIIVPDVDFGRASDLEWRRLLYVSCSRARQAVHLMAHNSQEELQQAVKVFADSDRVRPTWQALCRQLGLQLKEGGEVDPFDEPRTR